MMSCAKSVGTHPFPWRVYHCSRRVCKNSGERISWWALHLWMFTSAAKMHGCNVRQIALPPWYFILAHQPLLSPFCKSVMFCAKNFGLFVSFGLHCWFLRKALSSSHFVSISQFPAAVDWPSTSWWYRHTQRRAFNNSRWLWDVDARGHNKTSLELLDFILMEN